MLKVIERNIFVMTIKYKIIIFIEVSIITICTQFH